MSGFGFFDRREIPIYGGYDVVVCGGGPAGISAAISAAENGARTILIERDGFLGGTATTGLSIFGFFDSSDARIVDGVPRRIVNEMVRTGGAVADVPHFRWNRFTAFEPYALKVAADRLVRKSGVDLLLHTHIIDAERGGPSVEGVTVQNKGGRFHIEGKAFIDCTGDADIAHFSGAPLTVGRGGDGATQPPTLVFRLTGFDKSALIEYLRRNPGDARRHPVEALEENEIFGFCGLNDFIERMNREEGLGLPREFICFHSLPNPTDIMVVATRVNDFNGVDGRNLTDAEVETRRQAFELTRLLRRYVPGFHGVRLVDFAHRIGVRETRRLVGEYILSEDDLISARDFEDGIAKGGFPIDIHSPDGKGNVFEPLERGYRIPYRCLIAREVSNLWVAGRAISTSHIAHGSTRVIATCMATGQAAGTAAAICAGEGCGSYEIDIRRLRKTLTDQGAIVN